MKTRTLLLLLAAIAASGQDKKPKTGLFPEDWKYTVAPGVTQKEVTYYSDGTACYAKIFFPKSFSVQGKTPGVVLGQGWAGTHFSIEKYGARFAERGLVAMVIDYRGWGASDGFAAVTGAGRVGGDYHRDEKRFSEAKAGIVTKRTRLLPLKQVEDYRNAISYLQDEPGVDADRIGVWGSSFAGGHAVVVAALDARVKAVVSQVPAVGSKSRPAGPYKLEGKLLEDAIRRARTGQGGEYETGYSFRRMVDVETQQAVAEYNPMNYVQYVGARPVLFVVAEKDELINNQNSAHTAYEILPGPKDYIEVKGATHFEMYVGEAFERSSGAAADWYRKHLMLAAEH
jgi:dienelactone hydrolase